MALKTPRLLSITPGNRAWRRPTRYPVTVWIPLPVLSVGGGICFGTLTPREVFFLCIEHETDSSLREAPPTGAGALTGVDHVVVKTQSVETAKRFYGEQLGIRLALEQHVPEWGGTQLFFRTSSMSIEVIASDKAPAQDELWGLALKSNDLDATHARLLASGVAVSDIREGRKPGTRVCTVKSHTLNVPTLLVEHETV